MRPKAVNHTRYIPWHTALDSLRSANPAAAQLELADLLADGPVHVDLGKPRA
jgi:hypothetical protein